MKLVLIGTDHRLQASVARDARTRVWMPRDGGHRCRKLLAYCFDKLGAKAILEETHPKQEETAPTIGSVMAKERGLVWQSLGIGEPALFDALLDPPLAPSTSLSFLSNSYELFRGPDLRFQVRSRN
jgi:hypothetical protein